MNYEEHIKALRAFAGTEVRSDQFEALGAAIDLMRERAAARAECAAEIASAKAVAGELYAREKQHLAQLSAAQAEIERLRRDNTAVIAMHNECSRQLNTFRARMIHVRDFGLMTPQTGVWVCEAIEASR